MTGKGKTLRTLQRRAGGAEQGQEEERGTPHAAFERGPHFRKTLTIQVPDTVRTLTLGSLGCTEAPGPGPEEEGGGRGIARRGEEAGLRRIFHRARPDLVFQIS